MTEIWIWGLIASLILLAIGTSLKAASESVKVHSLQNQISALRSEIESLNKKHNDETNNLREFHAAEIEKLSKKISEGHEDFLKPIKYDNRGIV